jgi:hypothetical protein
LEQAAAKKSSGGAKETFPFKLHAMLESIDPNTSPHGAIVRWLPHGRAFQIFHLEAFESIVLPLHFRFQSKFASFQRQLNLYGFKRLHVTTAAGKSAARSKSKAYYHELFLRSRPHLCRLIPRNPIATATTATGTTGSAATTTTAGAACAVDRRALDPTSEPNFDRLPPLPETTTAVYGDAAVAAASLEDEDDASPDIPTLLPTTTARLKTTGLSISTHDQAAVASPLPFWPAPVVAAHGASSHEPHNALSSILMNQSTALEMALRQRLLEAATTTQPLSHDLVSLIRYQPPRAAAAPTTLVEYAALLNAPLQPPPPSLQQRMQQQLWGSSQQLHAAVITSAADLRLAGAAAAEASLHSNNHHNVLSTTSLWPSHRSFLPPLWRPSAEDDLASVRNHVSLLPTSSSNIHSLPPPPPTTSLGQHVLYAAGMMTRSAASAGATNTTAVNPPPLAPWLLSSSPAAEPHPLESAFPSCTTPTTTTAVQQYIHSLQQQEDSDSPSTLDPVLEALLLQRLRQRDLRQDM